MHASATRLADTGRYQQHCRAHSVGPLHRPLKCHRAARWLPVCAAERRCRCYDLSQRQVPYQQAWFWQQQLVAKARENASDPANACDDTLLLLQHSPVYTLGAGSSEEHLLFPADAPPLPLFRVERGGEVTFHGPGQLVMYPILNLRRHRCDLHWYLRSLEEVAIRVLHSVSGMHGERVEGLTGVWVGGRKLAAIGVRARQWITYHGLALNVAMDLAPFSAIVPCGVQGALSDGWPPCRQPIYGRGVSTVQQELIIQHGEECNSSSEQLLAEYSVAMLDAFAEVFDVTLQSAIGEPTWLGVDLVSATDARQVVPGISSV